MKNGDRVSDLDVPVFGVLVSGGTYKQMAVQKFTSNFKQLSKT